jgi:hypothetical protein
MLQTHNFDSSKTLQILSSIGVNEIVMGNMVLLEDSYQRIKNFGMIVTINKNVDIVTMSRACHVLRIIGKTAEKGYECKKYCSNRTVLKGTHYFDMTFSIHTVVSEQTKSIQPEMYSYSNIIFVKNEQKTVDHSSAAMIVEDYRY